jgi:hypothetical protein
MLAPRKDNAEEKENVPMLSDAERCELSSLP